MEKVLHRHAQVSVNLCDLTHGSVDDGGGEVHTKHTECLLILRQSLVTFERKSHQSCTAVFRDELDDSVEDEDQIASTIHRTGKKYEAITVDKNPRHDECGHGATCLHAQLHDAKVVHDKVRADEKSDDRRKLILTHHVTDNTQCVQTQKFIMSRLVIVGKKRVDMQRKATS